MSFSDIFLSDNEPVADSSIFRVHMYQEMADSPKNGQFSKKMADSTESEGIDHFKIATFSHQSGIHFFPKITSEWKPIYGQHCL